MEEPSAQPTPVTAEAQAPVTETPSAAAPTPEAQQAAQAPSWQAELDRADAAEIRRHPKVAGLIGSEIERARQAERQRQEQESQRRQQRISDEEMVRLLHENRDSLATTYPNATKRLEEIEHQVRQRDEHERAATIRSELAKRIGRAVFDLPDEQPLSQAELAELSKATAGKDDDEAIEAFARTAAQILAERRAQKRYEQWKAKDLAAEREAIRREVAAELLAKQEAPSLQRAARTPPTVDIMKMSDAEFAKLWETVRG